MKKTTIINIAIAIGAALLLGWVLSTYNTADFFRTSAWSLVPWGVVGVFVALRGRTKKEIWLLSLIYSEVLTISFTIADAINPLAHLLGLIAFGIISGLVGTIAIGVAAAVIRMDLPIKIGKSKD